MYTIEKCPYSESCKNYIGGIGCIDYNWEKMYCYKKKEEETKMNDFKHLGEGTIIYDSAKIVKKEVIEIGKNCKIDDFTFIYGGKGIKIGDHTHVGAFTSISGGGSINIGDHVGISQGVRFVTGTNNYKQKGYMSAASPVDKQSFIKAHIEIGNNILIATNAVILPGVKIGDGAIIGACTLVNKDIEPWSVNIGTPCRKIGERERF